MCSFEALVSERISQNADSVVSLSGIYESCPVPLVPSLLRARFFDLVLGIVDPLSVGNEDVEACG